MKSSLVILTLFLFILGTPALIQSCRKDKITAMPLAFTTPQGFPQPTYVFAANPVTEQGFELGKKLFYDGRLSVNGKFACASCHQPEAAFTTFDHDLSHGYNNSHTQRNAPGLFNLAWYPEFNQDGGAKTLEAVYQKHITSPTEMAETIENVLSKLNSDDAYKNMFAAAFGDDKISADRLYKALSQFVVNLVSAGSKYDKVKKGEAIFSAEESAGYSLFKTMCATCHAEPLFTDFSYRNTGFEVDPFLNDYGRMRVTGNRADSLKFRVPSLRNLEFTSYYGHDGRLSFFRMMVQHYKNGITNSTTLDPLLSNGIALSTQQENDVIAFLRTLSDSGFINNSRYKN